MNRLPRASSHAPRLALADGLASSGAGSNTRDGKDGNDANTDRNASVDGVPLGTANWDPFSEPGSEEHGPQHTPGTVSGPVEAPLRDRASVHSALGVILVEFNRLLEGRSREALAQAAHDGGWGMVEILPHLRDWETVHHHRISRCLTEEHPVLECLDDSLWSIEHDYSAQDPLKTFAEFRELRTGLIDLAANLDDAAWSRAAVLDCVGEVDIHWLLNDICDRDVIQIAQARDLLV